MLFTLELPNCGAPVQSDQPGFVQKVIVDPIRLITLGRIIQPVSETTKNDYAIYNADLRDTSSSFFVPFIKMCAFKIA